MGACQTDAALLAEEPRSVFGILNPVGHWYCQVLVDTGFVNGIQTLSTQSSEVSNSEYSHILGGGEWRAKVFHVCHAVSFDSWRSNALSVAFAIDYGVSLRRDCELARKRQCRSCESVGITRNRIRFNSIENVPASWRFLVFTGVVMSKDVQNPVRIFPD
jgi:hypothetical protein